MYDDLDQYREKISARKKLDKTRANFPKQLKDRRIKFCRIQKNEKSPYEAFWNTESDILYEYDDPRLINSIKEFGINYGVQCGHGKLVVIDWDLREIYDKHKSDLPDTFKTQSPSVKNCPHSYYFIKSKYNNPDGFRVDKANERIADVQGKGTCVVGPGSVHPDHIDGPYYKVVNDVPIAETTLDKIRSVFSQYTIVQDKKDKVVKEYPKKNNIFEIIKEKVSISSALDKMGINTKKNPTQCPFHTSKAGACLSFDDDKKVWYCHHCNQEGSVIDLVAIAKGFDPKTKDGLRQVIQFLKKETGINDEPKLNTEIPEDDLTLALEASASALYESKIYTFKQEWMIGIAKEYIDTFHQKYYPNIPVQFLYFSYLTAFSSLISPYIKINAQFEDQPRLYCVLVTNSGGQKSVAISALLTLFKEIEGFNYGRGFGSGEGLARLVRKYKNILVCPDEFISFLDKGAIKSSSLVTMVGTLFGENEWQNEIKDEKQSVKIEDAYVSFLTATTEGSFQEGWSGKYKSLGFAPRLLIIPGKIFKWELKDAVDPDVFESHREKIRDILDWVQISTQDRDEFRDNNRWAARKFMKLTPAAIKLHNNFCNDFTMKLPEEIQNRLQVYNLRLACLHALLQKKHIIDSEDIKTSIDILKWQSAVRQEKIPNVTDNVWAEYELWIRRYFEKRPNLKEIHRTSLAKAAKYKTDKTSKRPFNEALDYLIKLGDVIEDGKKLKPNFSQRSTI